MKTTILKSNPTYQRHTRGFSLIEILVVIAVIGIMAGIAIPVISGLRAAAAEKSKRNAQLTQQTSTSLESLDVAHVLPESLGGAEATTRLLREGLYVEDGTLEGTFIGIPNLPEREIRPASKYLNVVFGSSGLRLEYNPDT